jgi:adenylate cyclase
MMNPNNFDAYYYSARSSFARGQIQRSADLFLKASEVRREDFQSLLLLGQSLRMLGDQEQEVIMEGISKAKKQLQLDPTDKRVLSLAPGSMYDIGQKEEAFQMINKALDIYPEDAGVLINAACLFAKDHNKEKALTLLEKVMGKGFGKRDWIEHDPDYDSIRDEPRFQALLKKLK